MTELADVCELIVDCEHKTAPVQASGIPSIRTPNIGRGFFILNGVNRVSDQTYEEWTQRATPAPGDLVLAREAPVGNVAVIPPNERFCLGQRTVLIRPDKQIVDSYYLCYVLLTAEMQGRMLGQSGGATVHHLNMRNIRGLKMPLLPRLVEQKRIAGVLKAYDDLVQNGERRINLLEDAARRLYREWFVHLRFPGHESVPMKDGVPEGWGLRPLAEVAPFNYGKALKSTSRDEGQFPVYGSSGVVGSHGEALVGPGAIIVGRKGNVGSLFLAASPSWPIDTVFYVDPSFVSYRLLFALHSLNFVSSDAAVPGLNRSYAHSLRVSVPDEVVAAAFESSVAPMFEQMEVLKRQNARLAEARDLLLPKLMSGQLDVSRILPPDEVAA